MLYTKKTLVMLLVSVVLGGGAWYLNSTGVMDGLSSSVFGPSFVCSEENLKTQAQEYRQKLIKQRRANAYRDELESTIKTLRDAGNTTEMQEQQKSLRLLIRGIGAYNRFVKAYVSCQKKMQNIPVTTVPPETTMVLNSAPAPRVTAPSMSTISSPVPSTTQAPVTTTPGIIIPETTEAPVMSVPPETTSEVPETTELPATTEAPETTEIPSVTNAPETTESSTTTEYIPETTQPASATIPAEATEVSAPSV